MPITRELKSRPVLFLLDHPVVNEEKSGNAYSEYCSTKLKQDLLGAAASFNKNSEQKFHLGVTEVCYTYLSSTRPISGDNDWKTSIVSKKNIPAGETYHQCEWLKDIWVSPKVWESIQDTIEQIKAVQPKLIICAGKWSFLFFATFSTNPTEQLATIAKTKSTFKKQIFFGGLNKFRASLLTTHSYFELPTTVLIPIYNPQSNWVILDKKEIVARDYTRVAKIYRRMCLGESPKDILTNKRKYTLGTDLSIVKVWLSKLLLKIEKEPTKVIFDVETRQQGIDCIGLCYEAGEGFTIPFTELYFEEVKEAGSFAWATKTVKGKKQEVYVEMSVGSRVVKYRHFWDINDEIEVMFLLQKVMLHPNCLHVGQNYIYDCLQYYNQWRLKIHGFADLMIQHHVLYNYMQKDLALLASLYVGDFVQWKQELKIQTNFDRWTYNCKDVCYTKSTEAVLDKMLSVCEYKLQEFYNFQQHEVCKIAFSLMLRGVPVDVPLKDSLKEEFTALQKHALELLREVVNEAEFNPDSPTQIKRLFKDLCGINPAKDRKTGSESFGAKAMLVYLEEYPQWKTLLHLYLEYKRLGVFIRNFLNARISPEGVLYFWLKVAGTSTYRMACTKLLDGSGMNIQQLPSGARGGFKLSVCLQDYKSDTGEDSYEDLVASGLEEPEFKSNIDLGANFGRVKDFLIPPPDFYFYDIDYSAIDLHFVVYTADCKWAKHILVVKKDCVYRVMAEEYYGYLVTKKMEERQTFKAIIHGKDYRGGAITLAAQAGLSVPKVKEILRIYDDKCPEIEQQLLKQEAQVEKLGYVNSAFGARLWIPNPDNYSNKMWKNKAAAAPPQSAAGTLVNKGICRLEEAENPSKFNRIPVLNANGSVKGWSWSFNSNVKKGGKIQTLMQVHDSAPGIFRKDDVTAIRRIIEYFTIPLEINGDIMTIPVDVKVSEKSYGECNSELAKELLAKADAYIAEHPNWREEVQA